LPNGQDDAIEVRRLLFFFRLLSLATLLAATGCCVCPPLGGPGCYERFAEDGNDAGCPPDQCRPSVARDGTRSLRAKGREWLATLKAHAPGAHLPADPAPTPMFHPLPTHPVFANCGPQVPGEAVETLAPIR
jgi:hypothetical protein